MTTTRKLLILAAIGTFAGCTSTAPMTTNCADAVVKKIKIDFKKNTEIKVSPPVREVEQGQAIEFVFKGDAGTAVKIVGENTEDEWLETDGKGSPAGNSYFVCVGDGRNPVDYSYIIEVVGVGKLDPVVRVKTKGRGT